jgi:hypothetical protein
MERRSHDQRRRNEHQDQRRSDDSAQNAARREGPLSAAWSAGTDAVPLNRH